MDNVPNDEDDDASLPLFCWSVQRSLKGKGKHISSKEKGKQVKFKDKSAQVSSSGKDKHVLHSISRQNDSDDETAEDDDNDDDGNNDDDNDGDGNVHKETQQSHGMTLAQEDENYYLTQDTDHGYCPKIENQCRFLSTLTDYLSQGDDSQSQRYGRRQPDIQYSVQNLKIDKHRPHQMHGHQKVQIIANLVLEGEIVEALQIALNMEHVMPPQPLPQYPCNISYQGVLPQVLYRLPSQPLMHFPYGIPSHLASVINVGSYTMPYTQNYSPTSHDYYRRIDGDDDGDDYFEPHRIIYRYAAIGVEQHPPILSPNRDFEPCFGEHSGVEATLARLSATLYWTRMLGDVKNYIRECMVCQRANYNLHPYGFLQPLLILSQVKEDISMDFITHLPNFVDKMTILVIVDRLSKFAHFVALQTSF
ncbi:UNVERIFIED_CONTAM: Transposon Ty3-G Gag-Pol polyprotein [Sesamum angustifolium]|uniref:Transposon Ty3-G Gag-Pol polyprotein n=1 Tax=Sesamum angustifolium TaxID=2727405 RepID=A0AAW2NMI4_9LAMI